MDWRTSISPRRSPFTGSAACKATVACVRPPARFGRVVDRGRRGRLSFEEKPQAEGGLINGGFFVLDPSVLELIDGAHTVWEKEPMESLAATGQLAAWVHRGFWQPMDTLRDKQHLNALWDSGAAPWKLWQGRHAMAGPVTACRACGGRLTVTMADLGAAAALERVSRDRSPRRRARSAIRCAPRCARSASWCSSITTSRREELFGNYVYFSSYSERLAGAREALLQTWRAAASHLGPTSLVVELASNDGYLLKNFLQMGIPVLGIDPSDTVARAAESIGVPTLVEFFGETLARRARERGPRRRSHRRATTCSRTCRSSTISSPASRRC